MAKLQANYEFVSDKSKNPVVSSEYVKHGNQWLNDAINAATTELAKKANKDYVDAELAKKANAAELAALGTTVSGKADSSTVTGISDRVTQNTTKTVDLQSQIDSLVISGGGDSNTEVVQARTGTNGVTHTTLKGRIDSEVTGLKSDLYNDFTVNPGVFSGNRLLQPDGTYSQTAGYRVFNTPPRVKAGDVICFMLTDKNLTMGQAELRYMFAHDEGVYIQTFMTDSGANNASNFEIITVPSNIGNVTQIFMSFSSAVASSFRMFLLNAGTYSILNALSPNETISNSNYIILNENAPSSINELKVNTMYRIQVTSRVSWLPSDYTYDGNIHYIIKYRNKANTDDKFDNIIIYNLEMKPIYRKHIEQGTEYPWRHISNIDASQVEYIYVGANENFTKITDALAYAYSRGNVHITVRKGTYVITNEINIETAGSGPVIGNNTTLYFEQGAVMFCEYKGSNSNVKINFSPLNAGFGDFVLENVNIRASNVRYCIHDELNSDSKPYKHEYINCEMWLDNRNNTSWDSPQCIGGGLGEKGYIVIDGGYYDSLPLDNTGHYGAISYHNGHSSGCQSNIVIKNVIFNNSTARFGYYGSSTDKTRIVVSGCKLKVAPTLRAETADGTSPNVNMTLIAFNNTIG